MSTARDKARTLLDGFKGVDGNPFSEMLELNLLNSIENVLKLQEAEIRLEATQECINQIDACKRDTSGHNISHQDAVTALSGLSDSAHDLVTLHTQRGWNDPSIHYVWQKTCERIFNVEGD